MDNFICCYNEVIYLLWSILTIEHIAGGSACPKAWTLVLELINWLGNFEWPWAYHLISHLQCPHLQNERGGPDVL